MHLWINVSQKSRGVYQYEEHTCVLGKNVLANLPPQEQTWDAVSHGIVLAGKDATYASLISGTEQERHLVTCTVLHACVLGYWNCTSVMGEDDKMVHKNTRTVK